MSVHLHRFIEHHNVLERPTQTIHQRLRRSPTFYKIALIANHLFRTAGMYFLMMALPFGPLANGAVCLITSLFYRLTVEINCAYKFALPAAGGAFAFMIGKAALVSLATGTAFATLGTFAATALALLPLAAYFSYILLTVNYDVNQTLSD